MARFRHAVRPLSRRFLQVWAVLALVLALGAASLAIAHHGERQNGKSRGAALSAAKQNVPKVLTYDSTTVERDLRRSTSLLTGQFRVDFMRLAETVVVPSAKKDEVATKAIVGEAGVVGQGSEDKVKVLLFVNQITKNKSLKTPRQDGSRILVTMVRKGDRWLISDLAPV